MEIMMQKKYIPNHAKRRKKLKISEKVIISTLVVVLSLCSLMMGMLVAKYINEKSSDGLVIAKNFYFTSNLLDGKTHTLAPGTTTVTFTLGNPEDDLRFSEMDIEYKVTVDNNSVEVKRGTGTLAKGSVKDAEVKLSNLQPGTYTVTAVGKGGYTKTLTATIKVPAEEAKLYYYEDSSAGDYTLLTVWNEGDAAGEVTIAYTGIPDNTNPNMTDWTTNSSASNIAIGPHESKVFRFFKATDITVSNATKGSLY